jgi:glycosyltransferase involved in cell wall biosynthesis
MACHVRIKVLFITGALAFGGLERVIVNLCRNLDKRRFKASVVCIKSRGELAGELEAENIKVISLDANRSRLIKQISWFQLAKILRMERPDIIHSHNTAAFLDAVPAYCLSPCRALIHTDHTRKFPDKRRYMIAERIASIFADRIVAVSEETRQNLMKYEHICGRKIMVINNGIEKERYDIKSDPSSEKKRLDLDRFDFIVGLGVVLREQKGIRYLIEAAPAIIKKYPKTGFVIAGDGPLRSQLEKLTQDYGVKGNFVFLGARKDIPEILQTLDLYVLPSIWEGMPLCILEAMAARKCILATCVGGVPLAIRDGQEGKLVPPRDSEKIAGAIMELRENEAMRRYLASRAYQRFLAQFTVESMTKHYEQLYLETLHQNIKMTS